MSDQAQEQRAARAPGSPLPWTYEERVASICAADGEWVCNLECTNGREDDNGHFIVAAVNGDEAYRLREELRGARETAASLLAALQPFARFAEAWDRKPLSMIADEFYAIHTGTPFAASLRLSDCRAAGEAISAAQGREPRRDDDPAHGPLAPCPYPGCGCRSADIHDVRDEHAPDGGGGCLP